MLPGQTTRCCLWLLFLASVLSCAVVKKPTKVSELPPPPPLEEREEYTIRAGDELDIKFFYNPELNEHIEVRPDGRIKLELIPEVMAERLTVRELTERLKELYSEDLSDPEITVIVRSFSTHRIFVDGEVEKPGEQTLHGQLRAMQAISMAGGFRPTARLGEVIVIRRNVDRSPMMIPLRIKDVISGEDPSQDILLMPYDVVYVPRSIIANVNKWIDQYIRQNIPLYFGFRIDILP